MSDFVIQCLVQQTKWCDSTFQRISVLWLSLGHSSAGGFIARCIFACNDVSSLSIDTMWRPGTITRPNIRSSPPFSVSSVHIPRITLAAESVHRNVPTRILLSVKTIRNIEYSQDLSFSRPGVSSFWVNESRKRQITFCLIQPIRWKNKTYFFCYGCASRCILRLSFESANFWIRIAWRDHFENIFSYPLESK